VLKFLMNHRRVKYFKDKIHVDQQPFCSSVLDSEDGNYNCVLQVSELSESSKVTQIYLVYR
jgi:hypothetical protein